MSKIIDNSIKTINAADVLSKKAMTNGGILRGVFIGLIC